MQSSKNVLINSAVSQEDMSILSNMFKLVKVDLNTTHNSDSNIQK